MRLLVKAGADPLVVHHVDYHAGDPAEERSQTTNAVMAAAGMGGGGPWIPIERSVREAPSLESVTLAVELGADVNRANDDGRTALDAARGLKYESVEKFLTEKGAKPGTGNQRQRPGPPVDRLSSPIAWHGSAAAYLLDGGVDLPLDNLPSVFDG